MQLAHPVTTNPKALKIAETIEVVGKAPALQLWNPEKANLTNMPLE